MSQQISIASLNEEEQGLMIQALYVSPRVMALGVGACVLAAIASYANSMDSNYILFIAAFFCSGIYRTLLARDYKHNTESRSFIEWKTQAIKTGVMHGLLLGLFSAYSIAIADHYNELIAFCLMLGNLVAIPSRNFSSKRLINYQMIIIGTPVILAMLAQATWQYWVLTTFFIPLFVSMSQLATQSRKTLLQVIQRKVEIKKLLSRFDTATNFMQHGFLIIDEHDEIIVANSRALLLLGVENDGNWVGKKYQELLEHAVKLNRLSELACSQLSTRQLSSTNAIGTHKVIAQTNNSVFVESSTSFCEGQLVVLLEDVTERIRTADRITYMATHDSLTGLCNREHFHELFNQHLNQGIDGLCMLAVVDLDEFKHINDTYGHAAGDELLCSAASTIELICGEFAIASRFGGDEFVIFAPHIESEAEVHAFPEELLKALSHKVQLSHCSVQPKASVGIVVEERSQANSDAMFAKADLALYESKAKSRGGWTLYDEALDANHRERQLLKDDLAVAMEQDDLTVVFQPIVNLKSRRISTFEALSRWHHPTHGDVSPAVFIPLAEEMGIVGDITLLVLRKAIDACSEWPSDVGVSVNLSAIDFDNPDLVKEID
ncbi:MAG: putative bifunctional diguanylate cyclase/phosphodiesterase, partial [Granulosicoccaceae bacterium]